MKHIIAPDTPASELRISGVRVLGENTTLRLPAGKKESLYPRRCSIGMYENTVLFLLIIAERTQQ
jgi:hypothetical protein